MFACSIIAKYWEKVNSESLPGAGIPVPRIEKWQGTFQEKEKISR
jgi:hypothetical protein